MVPKQSLIPVIFVIASTTGQSLWAQTAGQAPATAAANMTTEFKGQLKSFQRGVLLVSREDGTDVMIQLPDEISSFNFVPRPSRHSCDAETWSGFRECSVPMERRWLRFNAWKSFSQSGPHKNWLAIFASGMYQVSMPSGGADNSSNRNRWQPITSSATCWPLHHREG